MSDIAVDIRRGIARLMYAAVLTLTACGAGETPDALPSPSGPPEIDYALVRQHALQFDVDVPNRPPGSQQELATATYILGHLQLAGYAPLLDAVPVRDQVQSTNVVAFPPSGEDPESLVTVDYAHDGRAPASGVQIGLFLELARALNVAEPGHRVAFVALGAEDAGSSKLDRFLRARDLAPELIPIPVTDGSLESVGEELFRSLTTGPE